MLTIAYYILKVIICSGILYGYYLLALRNKVFHRWNRFYLLAAVVLSLAAPLIKINIWPNSGASQTQVIHLIQAVSTGDEFVYEYTRNNSNIHINATNLSVFIYTIISGLLLAFLIQTLVRIKKLKHNYQLTIVEGINFINTDAEGTPFSFFNNIFWNDQIDINSATGKQIFKHEVAHVQEKHSYDKIFINIVLIFFWCNPFFWLIRKELNIIHEFIADKKALEDNDTAAFAAMILQATYPQQRFTITNNFFYSPLKRRLLMLTKNNNPKINYLSRLLVLPFAALVFFAFTLKAKTYKLTATQRQIGNDQLLKPDVSNNDLHVVNTFKNSQRNLSVANNRILVGQDTIPDKNNSTATNSIKESLLVLNGNEVTEQELNKLNPNNLKIIKILKPESAITKYGDKGKKGVIEITTREGITDITDTTLYETGTIIISGVRLEKSKDSSENNINGSINKKVLITLKKHNDTIPTNLKFDKVFIQTETPAQFPGGDEAWRRYIQKIIEKNIHELAKENKSGTCRVRFIVDVDGSVRDVKVLSMQGTKLAEISENAIRKGPKWVPAKQKDQVVAAYREQPITFTIQEDK